MEDELIRSLKKPFEKRSESDLFPIERMVRKIEFFQKYFAEQIDLNFSYYFEHDYATQNTTIINVDSVGDKFYVILQGQVGIYVKPNDLIEERSTSNKLLEKVKQRFRIAVKNNKFKDYQINKIQSQQSDMVLMKILLPGQSFGEAALIHNRPREFTAVALQPTHFALLRRNYFKEVVRIGQERSSIKEMGFFANLEIFEGWNVNSVYQIFKSLKSREYKIGEVIYIQKEEANSIYLIKEGAVDLIQQFRVEKDESDIRNASPLMKQRNRSFSRRVATIMRNQFVGLEDIHSEEQKHKYTCISSSSDTILYIIHKELYFNKIYTQTTSQIYVQEFISMQNKYQDLRHSQLQQAVDSQRQQQQQIIAKINASQNVEMFQFFRIYPGRMKTLTESSKKAPQTQGDRSQLYSEHEKIIDKSYYTRAKDRSLIGKVQTQSLYQNQAYRRVIQDSLIQDKIIQPQILHSKSMQIKNKRLSPTRPVQTTLTEEELNYVQNILQNNGFSKQFSKVGKRSRSTGSYSQRRVLRFSDS